MTRAEPWLHGPTLVRAGALALFVGLLHATANGWVLPLVGWTLPLPAWLDRWMPGARIPLVVMIKGSPATANLGYLLAAGGGIVAAFSQQHRRVALLVTSAGLTALLLRQWALPICAYVALLCVVVRSPIRVRFQIPLLFAAWLLFPIARAMLFPPQWRGPSAAAAIVWAQLAYASLYLVIERGRWSPRPSLVDDTFYLLAFPRLVAPFFQPISPRHIYQRELPRPEWRAVWRAIGLGLYGIFLRVVWGALNNVQLSGDWWAPLPLVSAITKSYCACGTGVFVSVALFRLLGYDIGSGFKQPFFARSFRDFFRRFNHYVRDAIINLILFPLQGSLRRHLSRKATQTVAGYLAIFIGSFLLNDLLVPATTSTSPLEGIERTATLRRMITLVIYWSAILLPRAGLEAHARRQSATWVRRVWENGRFLLLYAGLWALARGLRHGLFAS